MNNEGILISESDTFFIDKDGIVQLIVSGWEFMNN
jgi:hypothetical protein